MKRETEQLELWKESNRAGSAVVIYKAVMTIVVIAVMTGVVISNPVSNNTAGKNSLSYIESTNTAIANLGWAYILAMVICSTIFLLWKGKDFFAKTVLRKSKEMTAKVFLFAFSFFMFCQFLGQIGAFGLDALLMQFGKSASVLIEASTVKTTDPAMIIYAGVLAPIMEELLFRGVVLRGMQPFGKGIAVFTSSLLFGLIHANPLQIPFAFLIGIVLSYVTMEYDVRWSILLHAINNFGFGIILPTILYDIPFVYDAIFTITITISIIIVIVLLITKRDEIKHELSSLKIEKWKLKITLKSPSILVAIIVSVAELFFMIITTLVGRI